MSDMAQAAGGNVAEALKFPFARPGVAMAAEHAALRNRPTLAKAQLWSGQMVWLATRYDDVRAILGDPRFSSSSRHPNYPGLSSGRAAFVEAEEPPTMIRQDGAGHHALRRIFAGEFTHSRITALQPLIAETINALADKMEKHGAPFEFVQGFALPMPSLIIAKMLGVPYEDHAIFENNSFKKTDLTEEPAGVLTAATTLREYMRKILGEKAKDPEKYDDLLSRVYVKHVLPGHLSFEEMLNNVDLLILAGHETTANMTALGVLTLIHNPQAFEALRNDHEGVLVKPMVEELLRYLTVVHLFSGRVAMADIEIGGMTIRKDDGVIALIAPANHDPERFPDPEQFDYTRPRMPAHMAFGFGAHQCMGQTLARAELTMALPMIVRRFPNLHLAAPVETLKFKGHTLTHGVFSLPLAW